MQVGARPRLPYGSWPSPVTAAMVAASEVRLEGVCCDGPDVYWIEGRPDERGRCVIVHHTDSGSEDVIPAPFSARTFVHEYGGGAMLATDGTVYFANAGDGRLHRTARGSAPEPLTPELGDVRYADMALDATHGRLLCVTEDHRAAPVRNDISAVPLDGGEPRALLTGNDFYASPRVSADGRSLCWLTWNQPNMPWDGTELWVASIDSSGNLRDARMIAGGTRESVFQPAWSPDSTLHFVSDRTGWWNLYRVDGDTAVSVAAMSADCGHPLWRLRMASYGFLDGGRIALTASHDGVWRLHVLDIARGAVSDIDLPYTSLGPYLDAHGDSIVLTAGGPRDAHGIVRIDASSGARTTLRSAAATAIDASVLSVPEHITFPGHGGATTHAWYYRPRNDSVEPEPGTAPPLLVSAHGGPTGSTSATLGPDVQYWTSRGFAYLDVDYGGSTGYGRAYRDRLNGQSGVVDVGDCVAGAQHLAAAGEVDGSRLFVKGGSAGGYIVLCAMTFQDVFAAGASLFGIADIEALLADSHKFEARYEAPYPSDPAELHARSPVHFVDRVKRPVLLLQGLDDTVVPAAQSQMMFDALRAAGIPCAYLAFAGEGHGFRQAENIARTAEAELYFFCLVTGLEPPAGVEPIAIANLDRG